MEIRKQGTPTNLVRLKRGDKPSETSMKQSNLAATALINSAKKAMEGMRRLSVSNQTPMPMVMSKCQFL